MSTSTYSIFDFLKNCGGNWRNAVYIPCGFCFHPCRADQRGALLTADSYGRPRAVSVAWYEAVTGQQINPSECLGTLRRIAFDTVFRDFAVWECDSVGECLLSRLDGEVSAGPAQREAMAAVEPTEPAVEKERQLRRSFPSKFRKAPK